MKSEKVYKFIFITTLLIGSMSNANAEVFKGYPDMIVCEAGKENKSPGELVYYVESRSKKGSIIYRSTHRMLSMKVDKDGYVRADTGSFNNCMNQSLEQLRKRGSTFNFTKH